MNAFSYELRSHELYAFYRSCLLFESESEATDSTSIPLHSVAIRPEVTKECDRRKANTVGDGRAREGLR